MSEPLAEASDLESLLLGIKIRQDGRRCTGGWLWPAAVTLAAYLGSLPIDWNGKKVLELGAGTGYLGIFLALKGATVVVTDQAPALPILKQNIFTNIEAHPSRELDIHIHEFEWGTPPPAIVAQTKFDYVIASDVLYLLTDVRDLLLSSLADSMTDSTIAYICHETRIPEQEDSFFWQLSQRRFPYEKVWESPAPVRSRPPSPEPFVTSATGNQHLDVLANLERQSLAVAAAADQGPASSLASPSPLSLNPPQDPPPAAAAASAQHSHEPAPARVHAVLRQLGLVPKNRLFVHKISKPAVPPEH